MALPLYLAMTAAEMGGNNSLPASFAYMACHFSSYGTGLSNIPTSLPEGSLLILNDRTPIHGHDPGLIASQLDEMINSWNISALLLDFQRPGCEESAQLAKQLADTLPCPVGISEIYGTELDCPILLSPASLHTPLEIYLRPWQGRDIWLEAALDGTEILLTEAGASITPLPCCNPGPPIHRDSKLHCHYSIETEPTQARFTLCRTQEDLKALLEEAEALGVRKAVGLWQELSCRESPHPNARLSNP